MLPLAALNPTFSNDYFTFWMGRQLKVNKAKPREDNPRGSWSKKQDF